jgi:hypothetical protein
MQGVPKVMLLNGFPDRETRGMHALDYVSRLVAALNGSRDDGGSGPAPLLPPCVFVTHLFYVRYGPLAPGGDGVGALADREGPEGA